MTNTADDVATNPWALYEPSPDEPWDRLRAAHLHRRAGFAASWWEIERDLAEGHEASISRILNGKAPAQETLDVDEFERISTVLADAATASGDCSRLKAWWFYRLLFSPDPLGERLTLMWHNHFATSNQKVNDPAAMRRQNDLFRRLARARFGSLLEHAIHDPALLVWLDAPANRKGHPNENLARELLELFGLGVGHFTENDVRETARALTGWSVIDGESHESAPRHDDEAKTILGKTGNWRSSDVVRMIVEHPATADRLAWRICDQFMGEGVAPSAVKSLAAGLRSRQLDIGWAVATVVRSRAFFAPSNLGTRVQSPVEFTVNAVRSLEMLEPPPSTLVLADWAARIGQALFEPVNVGGWIGGRGWLSARALIGRTNFATALVDGRGVGRDVPLDPISLAKHYKRGAGRDQVITFYSDLLLGLSHANPAVDGPAARAAWNSDSARQAVARILAAPEAQVC
jgi:uncharacterized protein (DUF1800 family)